MKKNNQPITLEELLLELNRASDATQKVEGWSTRELADVWHTSTEMVRRRLYEAREHGWLICIGRKLTINLAGMRQMVPAYQFKLPAEQQKPQRAAKAKAKPKRGRKR